MITLDTILLMIVAFGAAVSAYYAWDERRLKLKVYRAKVTATMDTDFIFRINVQPLNRTIARCNVLYDGTQIRWTGQSFERYFDPGASSNVLIPRGAEKDDANVIIRDGTKTIKKFKFKDIPLIDR